VKLRLGGASTDSTPRDKIGDKLRRDSVEELRSNGDAEASEVAQELAGKAETFVDLEGAVKVWVIDKTLPPDGRSRFFEISPHDNEEVSPFRDLGFEEFGVSDGFLRRVNRAGADDNEDSIVIAR